LFVVEVAPAETPIEALDLFDMLFDIIENLPSPIESTEGRTVVKEANLRLCLSWETTTKVYILFNHLMKQSKVHTTKKISIHPLNVEYLITIVMDALTKFQDAPKKLRLVNASLEFFAALPKESSNSMTAKKFVEFFTQVLAFYQNQMDQITAAASIVSIIATHCGDSSTHTNVEAFLC